MDYSDIPDNDVTDLILLVHDKGHLSSFEALEPIFGSHLVPCDRPLYRGMGTAEKRALIEGRLAYASFTEDLSVARRFARHYGSGEVVVIEPRRGFSLVDFYDKVLTDEEKFEIRDLYLREKEWLVDMTDTVYRLIPARKAHL